MQFSPRVPDPSALDRAVTLFERFLAAWILNTTALGRRGLERPSIRCARRPERSAANGPPQPAERARGRASA